MQSNQHPTNTPKRSDAPAVAAATAAMQEGSYAERSRVLLRTASRAEDWNTAWWTERGGEGCTTHGHTDMPPAGDTHTCVMNTARREFGPRATVAISCCSSG